MAFIRKRGNSHQLIETYRHGGKVRQRILANLGPWQTIPDAINGWERYTERLLSRLKEWQDAKEEGELAFAKNEAHGWGEPSQFPVGHIQGSVQCRLCVKWSTLLKNLSHWQRRVEKETDNLAQLRRRHNR